MKAVWPRTVAFKLAFELIASVVLNMQTVAEIDRFTPSIENCLK